MFDRRKYISAAVSVFYPTFASVNVDTGRIADVVRGKYFPPTIAASGPAGSQVMSMLSEHGHSQITVSQEGVTLMVTFSADWERDGDRGREYVHDRAPLLLAILDEIDPDLRLLYAGAGFTVRLPATASDDAADWLARVVSDDDHSECQDVAIRTTRRVDDRFYLNSTIGSYRHWGPNMFSAPYVRLPIGLAIESGVEITEDFNSRYAFNKSRDVSVDAALLNKIVDEAYRAVEHHSVMIEKGERFKL